MMDYALSALAPKLEVGQAALYDALRSRDSKRATRIVQRIARSDAGGGSHGRGRGNGTPREKEADLNAPDSRGLRPIHLAAMGGMSETVRALLFAGVPVDAMGAEGNTALHLASYHKQEGVVAVLMRAGSSPNLDNIRGRTPIDLAATETTLALLCPLHYAAGSGMLDNLVSLVSKGMSVNSVGRGGETPLHASAASGTPDAARLLLAKGADPLRKTHAGETALDLARRFRRPQLDAAEMVELLEKSEAVAVVEKAEREAMEAERLAAERDGKDTYAEGDSVMYKRNGEEHRALVMKVHRDDEEPYYTIRVEATGREKQTDANHLVRAPVSPSDGGTAQESHEGENVAQTLSNGASSTDDSAAVASPSPSASVADCTQNDVSDTSRVGQNLSKRSSRSSSPGKRTRHSMERGKGSQHEEVRRHRPDSEVSTNNRSGRGNDWKAARALFLEVATRLKENEGDLEEHGAPDQQSPACSSSTKTSDGPAGASEAASARALAEAFAAVPANEAGQILRQRVLEIGRENFGGGVPESRRECASELSTRESYGSSSVSGAFTGSTQPVHDKDDGRENATGGGSGTSVRNGLQGEEGKIEVQEEERVAHAIADACRDIALKGLLGRDSSGGVRRVENS